MHRILLVLACMARLGHVRRVQISLQQLSVNDLAGSQARRQAYSGAAAFNPSGMDMHFLKTALRPAALPAVMQVDFSRLVDDTREKMSKFKEKDALREEQAETIETRTKEGNLLFADYLFADEMLQQAGLVQPFDIVPVKDNMSATESMMLEEKKRKLIAKILDGMDEETRADPQPLIDEIYAAVGGTYAEKAVILANTTLLPFEEVGRFCLIFDANRKALQGLAAGESLESVQQGHEEMWQSIIGTSEENKKKLREEEPTEEAKEKESDRTSSDMAEKRSGVNREMKPQVPSGSMQQPGLGGGFSNSMQQPGLGGGFSGSMKTLALPDGFKPVGTASDSVQKQPELPEGSQAVETEEASIPQNREQRRAQKTKKKKKSVKSSKGFS